MTRFAGIIYGFISYIGRRKTFYTVLGFGLVFVFISSCFYSENLIINQRTIEQSELIKIVRAVTLYLSTFWGMIFAILMGMTTSTSETDSKQIYLVLSKPITRAEYILSRMFGALVISFSIIFIMSFLSWIIYNLRLGMLDLRLWIGVGTITLDLALVISFVTLISLIIPRILAGFIGIISYLSSFILSIEVIKELIFPGQIPVHIRIIARIIYIIVPPFASITKLATNLTNELSIGQSGISTLIHALAYLITCLFLCVIIFRRKEF